MDFAHRVVGEIPGLRRYARALTNDRSGADDLVQECLCRALQKGHLFQPGTNLRAWLFTILHHQYVSHIRRAVREAPMLLADEAEPSLALPERAGPRLTLRDLERALVRLPAPQREVVLLIGLEGMSYEHAAQTLAVPPGTIRSRLSRARSALRDLLDGTAAVRQEIPSCAAATAGRHARPTRHSVPCPPCAAEQTPGSRDSRRASSAGAVSQR